MESGDFWSRLPEHIMARVMAHFPVPVLCTCRCVCKTWNELLRNPEFVDQVCDLDVGRKQDAGYLFVTLNLATICDYVSEYDGCWVDDAYRRTTCFLDLEAKRWYSIPVDAPLLAPTDANIPCLLLAMTDGLVCELSALNRTYDRYQMVIFDPVAKTRRALPNLTLKDGRQGPICRTNAIAMSVDTASRSFKLFVLNNELKAPHAGFFVFESSTGAWRELPNPPDRVRDSQTFPSSSVFFRGSFYSTFYLVAPSFTLLLLSFNLEENCWREVLAVQSTGFSRLVVTGNRMFMSMWVDAGSMFEIREIMVAENCSQPVVRISYATLQPIFCERNEHFRFELQSDMIFGFPLNSNSVVLMSEHAGKLITYDVSSGAVGEFPVDPLRPEFPLRPEGRVLPPLLHELPLVLGNQPLCPYFGPKLMNLSLRNILSTCLPTNGS